MAVVEARFDGLQFPPCCCGCASRGFRWRSHTEKVVIWTVISITRYRMVTLQIPACDDCVRRPWYWYGAAAVVLGLAFLYAIHASDHGREVGIGILLPFALGIGLVFKGLASKPLKILAFDSDGGMLKLKIRSEEMARKLLALRGNHEGEHRLVSKPLMIVLGVVLVPFVFMLLGSIFRHHGT